MTDGEPGRPEPADAGASRRRGSRVGLVLGATAVAGAIGYLIQAIAGAGLDAGDYAVFGVFWATLYLVVGGVGGIQQEVARASREAGPADPASRRRVLPLFALVAAAVLAAVVLVLALVFGHAVFGPHWVAPVVAIVVGSAAYVGFATIAGAFYGRRAWALLAVLIVVDPALRAVTVALALPTGDRAAIDWAVVAPIPVTVALGVVLFALFAHGRTHVDVGVGRLLGNAARTVVGATATAVLVSALPLFIGASSAGVPASEVGAVIFNITLTRAPLVIPVMALQSLLIVYFRDHGDRVWSSVGRILGVIAAGTGVLTLAAWLFAPAVIGWLFGPDYVLDAGTEALIVATAGLTAALCATGPVVISQNGHSAFLVGWLVAAAVVIAMLFLPGPLEQRTILALTAGPVAGLAVHLGFLRSVTRRGGRAAW